MIVVTEGDNSVADGYWAWQNSYTAINKTAREEIMDAMSLPDRLFTSPLLYRVFKLSQTFGYSNVINGNPAI